MTDNTKDEKSTLRMVVLSCDERIKGRFEALLRSKGWKQQRLADEVSIDKANISRITHGLYFPCVETRIKIAVALGVDSATIWDKKEELVNNFE